MILNALCENGQVFVYELSKEFDVSQVTIRNDLETGNQNNKYTGFHNSYT
jgi:DeoR/GlpR family transcriptional regulator of sugar metabolism